MPAINLARPRLRYKLLSEDGSEYEIDPDFRVVLRCLAVLGDPDKPDLVKALFVAKALFKGNPPPDMWAVFSLFVGSGEQGEPSDEALVDFEQDADAIYASFRQQYGINLLRGSMHWDEFRALLAGLGDNTAFGKRVSLRSLDMSEVPEQSRARVQRIKDAVAIAPRMSKREVELQTELDRRLAAGEDAAEIIEQLKGV